MKSLKAYAIAAHFGPTMLITTMSFLLAARLWWEGPAYLIAFTVFLGQLLIGWSNDIYDYQDDLKHNRVNKPLVSGQLQIEDLKKATFILLPIALLANLLGPLGLKGGAVYLLGVGCGIAYNFYFKFRITSPLVYFIALAALPASIFYAVDRNPPLWVLATSSLLGVAFHFANVLKDLSADRDSNIGGLPQRLGRRASLVIIAILLVIVITILLNSPISSTFTSRVI
jgi:4-hydroxybenzoate polyprenyltransferase